MKMKVLFIVASLAILGILIDSIAVNGVQMPHIATSMSVSPSGESGSNISSPLAATMSPHTLFSVVLILGMAAIGLMILRWGETKPKRPYR